MTENWWGKFQFDIGKAEDGNELAVKDAFMQYRGFSWGSIKIGNVKPYFSREFMTSSKRQQMVERSFTGDHNYGSLDRGLGFHLDGENAERGLGWRLSGGMASHDPDVRKMDFDTPANRNEDFNDGRYVSGRIDWFPLGVHDLAQGDLERGPTRFSLSVAGYAWQNDDDNNTYTVAGTSTSGSKADLDSATGLEVSAGIRGHGLSADLEVQRISGELVDGNLTAGLYEDGDTDLDIVSLEGGYLVAPSFEVIGGYELLDASSYGDEWTRYSAGWNYFWNRHKAKVQLTYRMNESVDGIPGRDEDETFLQFQYVF